MHAYILLIQPSVDFLSFLVCCPPRRGTHRRSRGKLTFFFVVTTTMHKGIQYDIYLLYLYYCSRYVVIVIHSRVCMHVCMYLFPYDDLYVMWCDVLYVARSGGLCRQRPQPSDLYEEELGIHGAEPGYGFGRSGSGQSLHRILHQCENRGYPSRLGSLLTFNDLTLTLTWLWPIPAAAVAKGRRVAPNVKAAMVVPGSGDVLP